MNHGSIIDSTMSLTIWFSVFVSRGPMLLLTTSTSMGSSKVKLLVRMMESAVIVTAMQHEMKNPALCIPGALLPRARSALSERLNERFKNGDSTPAGQGLIRVANIIISR